MGGEEVVRTYDEVKYSKVGAFSSLIIVRTCNFDSWCGEEWRQYKRYLLLEWQSDSYMMDKAVSESVECLGWQSCWKDYGDGAN